MENIKKIVLSAAAITLMGAGCLSFGGKDTAPDGGLWQTVDGGKNWNQLSALPQASGVGSIGGVNVNAIEIDPSDSSVYYLATKENGLFYTFDNGSTWQRPEEPLAREGNVLDVEVDSRDVCTIYALKADRVLKSTDCARTFNATYVESREGERLTAFVIDWFNPDILWAGTSNGEVIETMDGGVSWTTMERLKSDISTLLVSNVDSRVVLVGTKTKGLYVRDATTGEFVSYYDTFRDLEFDGSNKVYSFTQSDTGSKIVMSSDYGLLASTDFGATWASVPIITPPGDLHIWSVAMDPKNDNVFYYGTGSTLQITTSGGESWETVELPSSRAATALAVHPTKTNILLVGFTLFED